MINVTQSSYGYSVINLTVGDDASMTVELNTDDGSSYEMSNSEYLIFNVREKPSEESELLIDLRSDNGSNEIVFSHDDTKNLEPGYYSAEIQLMTEDGKRITVWPVLTGNTKTSKSNRKNFCLMTEVVYE